MTEKSPLKWHGGKHYLADWIVSLMPAHTRYVEPYAGGLSVLLRKNPEGVAEYVNDLDRELANFWSVLQDEYMFREFLRRASVTPLSQEGWQNAQELQGGGSPVTRALLFFVACRQSRQGLRRDYCTPTRRTRRGMNENVSAWLSAVDGLPDVHQRLRRVEVWNRPALEVIQRLDSPETLFYLDPPYLHETRSTTGEYRHEMTETDHDLLLQLLGAIQGKFLLSGYPSELYGWHAAKQGWSCHSREIDNKASGAKTKQLKVECVWANFQIDGEAPRDRV